MRRSEECIQGLPSHLTGFMFELLSLGSLSDNLQHSSFTGTHFKVQTLNTIFCNYNI